MSNFVSLVSGISLNRFHALLRIGDTIPFWVHADFGHLKDSDGRKGFLSVLPSLFGVKLNVSEQHPLTTSDETVVSVPVVSPKFSISPPLLRPEEPEEELAVIANQSAGIRSPRKNKPLFWRWKDEKGQNYRPRPSVIESVELETAHLLGAIEDNSAVPTSKGWAWRMGKGLTRIVTASVRFVFRANGGKHLDNGKGRASGDAAGLDQQFGRGRLPRNRGVLSIVARMVRRRLLNLWARAPPHWARAVGPPLQSSRKSSRIDASCGRSDGSSRTIGGAVDYTGAWVYVTSGQRGERWRPQTYADIQRVVRAGGISGVDMALGGGPNRSSATTSESKSERISNLDAYTGGDRSQRNGRDRDIIYSKRSILRNIRGQILNTAYTVQSGSGRVARSMSRRLSGLSWVLSPNNYFNGNDFYMPASARLPLVEGSASHRVLGLRRSRPQLRGLDSQRSGSGSQNEIDSSFWQLERYTDQNILGDGGGDSSAAGLGLIQKIRKRIVGRGNRTESAEGGGGSGGDAYNSGSSIFSRGGADIAGDTGSSGGRMDDIESSQWTAPDRNILKERGYDQGQDQGGDGARGLPLFSRFRRSRFATRASDLVSSLTNMEVIMYYFQNSGRSSFALGETPPSSSASPAEATTLGGGSQQRSGAAVGAVGAVEESSARFSSLAAGGIRVVDTWGTSKWSAEPFPTDDYSTGGLALFNSVKETFTKILFRGSEASKALPSSHDESSHTAGSKKFQWAWDNIDLSNISLLGRFGSSFSSSSAASSPPDDDNAPPSYDIDDTSTAIEPSRLLYPVAATDSCARVDGSEGGPQVLSVPGKILHYTFPIAASLVSNAAAVIRKHPIGTSLIGARAAANAVSADGNALKQMARSTDESVDPNIYNQDMFQVASPATAQSTAVTESQKPRPIQAKLSRTVARIGQVVPLVSVVQKWLDKRTNRHPNDSQQDQGQERMGTDGSVVFSSEVDVGSVDTAASALMQQQLKQVSSALASRVEGTAAAAADTENDGNGVGVGNAPGSAATAATSASPLEATHTNGSVATRGKPADNDGGDDGHGDGEFAASLRAQGITPAQERMDHARELRDRPAFLDVPLPSKADFALISSRSVEVAIDAATAISNEADALEFLRCIGLRPLLDALLGRVPPDTRIDRVDVIKGICSLTRHDRSIAAEVCVVPEAVAVLCDIMESPLRGFRSLQSQADRDQKLRAQTEAVALVQRFVRGSDDAVELLRNNERVRRVLASIAQLDRTQSESVSVDNIFVNGKNAKGGVAEMSRQELQYAKRYPVKKPQKNSTTIVDYVNLQPSQMARVALWGLGGITWRPKVPGQRGLRILSFDGGGTKGVLSLAFLREIMKRVNRSDLEPHQMFDIICGTSTGGIIAGLLGCKRVKLSDAELLYDNLIGEIFKQRSNLKLVTEQAAYDEKMWENILYDLCGDQLFLDSNQQECPRVFFVSTQVNLNPPLPMIWRNYNYPPGQKSRYPGAFRVNLQKAVRATTAAPTFFTPVQWESGLYSDGALVANNPTAIALQEAKVRSSYDRKRRN